MSAAYFEDHPTDPNKVILRKKPYLDKGADYEHGFVDGMQYQMQSSVDKAVNAMSKREWVGLTRSECLQIEKDMMKYYDYQHECKTVCLPEFAEAIEQTLRRKNT